MFPLIVLGAVGAIAAMDSVHPESQYSEALKKAKQGGISQEEFNRKREKYLDYIVSLQEDEPRRTYRGQQSQKTQREAIIEAFNSGSLTAEQQAWVKENLHKFPSC